MCKFFKHFYVFQLIKSLLLKFPSFFFLHSTRRQFSSLFDSIIYVQSKLQVDPSSSLFILCFHGLSFPTSRESKMIVQSCHLLISIPGNRNICNEFIFSTFKTDSTPDIQAAIQEGSKLSQLVNQSLSFVQ